MRTRTLSLLTLGTSVLLAAGCGGGVTGTWKVTSDQTAAGFSTIAIHTDATYLQTGRTDGQPESGTYTQPETFTLDPDFGAPPAGMTGPYIVLDNAPQGDGEWVYGWTEAGSQLTLNRYAQRNGMGVRWAAALTIELAAE